jgi:hypothetical protein
MDEINELDRIDDIDETLNMDEIEDMGISDNMAELKRWVSRQEVSNSSNGWNGL